jgi:hypothetical protein
MRNVSWKCCPEGFDPDEFDLEGAQAVMDESFAE